MLYFYVRLYNVVFYMYIMRFNDMYFGLFIAHFINGIEMYTLI